MEGLETGVARNFGEVITNACPLYTGQGVLAVSELVGWAGIGPAHNSSEVGGRHRKSEGKTQSAEAFTLYAVHAPFDDSVAIR
jgi:hypothetical protein